MDALVLCGGEGTRLDAGEKPLYEVAGEPMVGRVLDALDGSGVDTVYAAVTPQTPDTRTYVRDRATVIDTAGEGYVADLTRALETVGTPAVTAVADLPLLTAEHVDSLLNRERSTSVCVPTRLQRALDVRPDRTQTVAGEELSPSGLNLVGDGEDEIDRRWDARLAVNVNYASDATVAERLC
ncbi:NTP transferase domain-containing protein [Halosegnis longus]|uniref:Cobalamin biosynthesis protein CobY n=1 Tax=Halosegnis longus TaxID=2216012 RepID=A0AAJ4R763_9EURY|nr:MULTISPECIES: NTP transferase domain-containing protein [Halobacteriales]RNJ25574.1 cobalamin biosynthesis protein CobY [Salella cibi]